MGHPFAIGFEQVELIEGLEADQPVWLYLRGTLYDAADLDKPLIIEEVGSFPPDANRLVDDSFPTGDGGRYADSLPIAFATPNKGLYGAPRFQLAPIYVEPGQVLEVIVSMIPKVWFTTITVPASEADRFTIAAFTTLFGAAAGGGLIGAAVGLGLGLLFGEDEDAEVEVPCMQSVITARHLFSFDDLVGLNAEPMRRFGPRDGTESTVCGNIDSFYWLSANHFPDYPSFGANPPPPPGDCELHPHAHFPTPSWLTASWGDGIDRATSCIFVRVDVIDESKAAVIIAHGPSGAELPHAGCRIDLVVPRPAFIRNFYDDECPARSVRPACGRCARFTNLPRGLVLAKEMLALAFLGAAHEGAGKWMDLARVVSAGPGRIGPARRQLAPVREACYEGPEPPSDRLEAQSLVEGWLARELAGGDVELWPTSTQPRREADIRHAGAAVSDVIFEEKDSPFLAIFGSFRIQVDAHQTLYSYAEFKDGEPECGRLRYVKKDATGAIVADVLLVRFPDPVR